MDPHPPTPRDAPRAASPAPTREIDVAVVGMTCASCVRHVESALAAVPGVADAAVNLATERARVRFDPARADVAQLRDAVARAGYALEVPAPAAPDAPDDPRDAERQRELTALRRKAVVSLAIGAAMMALMYLPRGARRSSRPPSWSPRRSSRCGPAAASTAPRGRPRATAPPT